VGGTIDWTLRGFHNRTGNDVTNFTIIDIPGRGLNFSRGNLPAFTNAAGITFDIRYTVYGSDEVHTFLSGIDASRPFTFSLPQSGNLRYTNIGLFFGNVPADFGLGNEIVLTFVAGTGAPNNELINRFVVRYDNVEHECRTTERPTVVPRPTPSPAPPSPGRLPQTGLDSRIPLLLGGLALSALMSVAAVIIIRKHKKENVS